MIRSNFSKDRAAIAKAVGIQFSDTDTCIVRVEENTPVGGFLFSNFTGRNGSIWAHVAGMKPGWLTKELLKCGFEFAFVDCGCRLIFTRIAEDNKKSLDFCEKLGFTPFTTLPDVYPDGTGQRIFRMYAHECRWLPAAWHTSKTAH